MNSVQLLGRLTRDPDVRYTDGGSTIAKFSLAVDRRFKQEGGDTADFINCIAFGKTAEFIEKFFSKGTKIALNGRIQTGSYTNKENVKVFTTDVVVENVEFAESKNNNSNVGRNVSAPVQNGEFMSIPDGIEDELPFN